MVLLIEAYNCKAALMRQWPRPLEELSVPRSTQYFIRLLDEFYRLTYITPDLLSSRTIVSLETQAFVCFYTVSMTDNRVGSSNARTHFYTCKLAQDRLRSCLGFCGQLSLVDTHVGRERAPNAGDMV